ncbi:T9SS type A sorting domain-containing protein [Carboxylicivirga mesophila]|uniref:T9SS type A sorting domain-containing protein n=1 Tax=Carboxylicivirga mesophila TaxID=1166478 RepID=A0ABS5KB82_9BACT|nr:LamG-like jellyroll fold domain-containing protein [Carboxylicivirga mesophila]MBS2211786.1 T9SS type A sorting domain-containing protein [Carboxylicivirga mesophila]
MRKVSVFRKVALIVAMVSVGFVTSYGQLASYNFSGNLNDDGSNAITAVSNYGAPVFGNDKDGTASSAWEAPGETLKYLSITGYKGIGGDGQRTVAAWFKTPSSGPSRKSIVAWGTNSGKQMFNVMIHNATGTIRIEAGACNVQSTVSGLNDDQWHHVAVTYNPVDGPAVQDVKIYVDGVFTPININASYNPAQTIETVVNQDVRIGAAEYSNNYFWTGMLDGVRIYDVALSASEITALHGVSTDLYDDKINAWCEVFSTGNGINISSERSTSLSIYSVNGQNIYKADIEAGQTVINPNVINGIYLVKIEDGTGKILVRKVALSR